jgi:hypothetical protein
MLAQKYTILAHSDPIVLRRLAKILNTHHSIDGFYVRIPGMPPFIGSSTSERCNQAKIKNNRLIVRAIGGTWRDISDNWEFLDVRSPNGAPIEPSRIKI